MLCVWRLRGEALGRQQSPLAPPQGGQNVNKVNTKAELRFNLSEVRCLPPSPPLCLLTLLPTLTDAEFGLVASRRGGAPG